jgi:hypothetical protein
MRKGCLGTMPLDYKRHGTTTLFAALNALDGTAISHNMRRHCHQERTRFLNRINAQPSTDKAVYVILDNYASHKHPKVWAWLNAVEGYFAKLTRRRLKRGFLNSLVDLQAAIHYFVAETNENSNPLN